MTTSKTSAVAKLKALCWLHCLYILCQVVDNKYFWNGLIGFDSIERWIWFSALRRENLLDNIILTPSGKGRKQNPACPGLQDIRSRHPFVPPVPVLRTYVVFESGLNSSPKPGARAHACSITLCVWCRIAIVRLLLPVEKPRTSTWMWWAMINFLLPFPYF
jgi:hypothetical protein